MTTSPDPNPAPVPTLPRLLVRNLVAAIGMIICALAPVALTLVPGYADWMSVERQGAEGVLQLLADIGRLSSAFILAAALLLIAARVEKVRLRDYFGRVGAARAWGVLLATTAAAALVTAGAAWLPALAGLDADRVVPDATTGFPVIVIVLFGLARAFLLQGIQEEWWFRGFAFRGHEHRPWLVLGVTTIVFTLLHLVSSGGQESMLERVLYLAVPLGMGLWGGVERWCTGTVWGAVGIHGGIHTGLLVPTLLGWPFGPMAWLILGAILCVAAVVRLLLAKPWRRDPVGVGRPQPAS